MTERAITLFEEKVIQLIHHDFAGLTQAEAAERLNVSQAQVSRAVSQLKIKAPQLFPVLTKQQKYVRDCIAEEGFSHLQTAILAGVSKKTVDSIVTTLKAKGISFAKPHKVVPYETYYDEQTIRKF